MFASYHRDDAVLDPLSAARSKHRSWPSTRKERELAFPLALRCDRTECRNSSVWLVVDYTLASRYFLDGDLCPSAVVIPLLANKIDLAYLRIIEPADAVQSIFKSFE